MKTKSTIDGLLCVMYELNDFIPADGFFVDKVAGKEPVAETELFDTTITISGDIKKKVLRVKVVEARVVIWGFKSIEARSNHDSSGIVIGGILSNRDRMELSRLAPDYYLAYRDPKTGEWIKYDEMYKRLIP